jgi:predicted small lipoprotein YifL
VSPSPLDLLSSPPIQERPIVKLRFAHLAVIGVLAAAFALAGCGRKGALDPPPGATAEKPAKQQSTALNPIGSREKTQDSGGFDADGKPVAPANAPKKRLPMDWLIE